MNSKAEKNLDNQLSSSNSEPESSGFHQRLSSLLPAFKSVRAFATASGVSQTGLQRLINGGEPTLSTLVALAKAGGVSVQWLATGEGSMKKGQPTSEDISTRPVTEEAAPVEDVEAQAAMAGLCARALDEWLIEQRRTMPPQVKQETIKVLYKYLRDRKTTDMAEVSSLLRALAA